MGRGSTHFTEDGGEFNQIERNFAMTWATICAGSRPVYALFPACVGCFCNTGRGADAGLYGWRNCRFSAWEARRPEKTGAA